VVQELLQDKEEKTPFTTCADFKIAFEKLRILFLISANVMQTQWEELGVLMFLGPTV